MARARRRLIPAHDCDNGELISSIAPSRRRTTAAGALVTLLLLLGLSRGLAQGLGEFSKQQQQQQQQQQEDKLSDFNRVVQASAFKAFKHPKTGVILTVDLNLTRVASQAVRFRTGSLRRRGFVFNEFTIPIGAAPVAGAAYPLRIVLVYRRFTQNLYSVANFTILSPVIGIKVYDAANLPSPAAVPEIDFGSGASNFTVRMPVSVGARCAVFDELGDASIFGASGGGECSWGRLGDFALVVPGSAAAGGPMIAPTASEAPARKRKRRRSGRWKAIVGGVLGGIGGLVLVALLVWGIWRWIRRSRVAKMEQQSDRGEALQTSLVGGSRAPVAGAARTKPVLESEYAAA